MAVEARVLRMKQRPPLVTDGVAEAFDPEEELFGWERPAHHIVTVAAQPVETSMMVIFVLVVVAIRVFAIVPILLPVRVPLTDFGSEQFGLDAGTAVINEIRA